MKRFTETEKWNDPWFRRLKPDMKLLWNYLCDRCDNSGVWKVDWELVSFHTGVTYKEADVKAAFGERVCDIDRDRWWLPKFIHFQFGNLNPTKSRVHKSVETLMLQHGLDTHWIGYRYPSDSPQEKDKDKDKVQDKGKGCGENQSTDQGAHQDDLGAPKPPVQPTSQSLPERLHGIPASVEEVIAYGQTCTPNKVPEAVCRRFWAYYEGIARRNPNGQIFWVTKGDAIVTNWKVKLPEFDHPKDLHAQSSHKPGVSGNTNTANEGSAGDYSAAARRKAAERISNVQRP